MNKKWFSALTVVFLSLVFMLLLEAILQTVGFGKNFDFVIEGKLPDKAEKSSLNSQYIALHYFHHLPVKLSSIFSDDPWFEDTEFSHPKSPGVYRIFLVGASTTRGFPFSRRKMSYGGFMEEILHDVLPDHKIEVINAGYDALSSFGVLDVVRQIIDQSPDLIIVYSGHNEFIGHFGVNSTVNLGQNRFLITTIQRLHASRLFLLNELALLKLKSFGKPDPSRNSGINLFKVMLRKDKFHWTAREHEASEKNFERNLQAIADLGRRKGVDIVFSTLVSNWKDFSPLRSELDPRLSPGDRRALIIHLQNGLKALHNKNFKEGVRMVKKSLALDPKYAFSHYELGRGLEMQGDYSRARDEYLKAREWDRVHLRGCLTFNRIIRRVGERNHDLVIDMGKEFEQASAHGLVGNNFFLEHVHPNINGHLIMADAIVHSLSRYGYIEPRDHWQWRRMHRAEEYVRHLGFDRKEYVHARATVGRLLLDFPFYRCREGREMLDSVGRANAEKKLIDSCFQVTASREFAVATLPE